MNPVLIGWSMDERSVLLGFKGIQDWFPVEWSGVDGDPIHVRVGATRYLVGSVGLTEVAS